MRRGKVLSGAVSNHTRTNGSRSLSHSKAGTHLPLPTGSHTAAHRAKQGAFWMGALSLPSERFARFGNPARLGLKTANFAAFWPWSGVFPKNAESLRDSDALMRVAVTRRRGPAGLHDPIAVSLIALMGFTVLVAHDNSTPRKILAGFTRRFHTPVRSMRLATRCRSVALSTASICR